jgi:hypothetical protein
MHNMVASLGEWLRAVPLDDFPSRSKTLCASSFTAGKDPRPVSKKTVPLCHTSTEAASAFS